MNEDVTHLPVPHKDIHCNKCRNESAIRKRAKLECPICGSRDIYT